MLQKYETEIEYTDKLQKMRKQIILIYKKFVPEKDLSEEKYIMSFEAKIGSKADEFASIKSKKYFSAGEFRDAWIKGLIESSNYELIEMIKNHVLREYIILFLERSYVKNPNQYKKSKLEISDRELYLGSNDNVIGVFIAPRNEIITSYEWKSYYSKGLKTKYTYLTLGQLKHEGYLIGKIVDDMFCAQLNKVDSFNDVVIFYDNFKNSGSPFEKKFIDIYTNYVKQKSDWTKVPMLLPEVRWGKNSVYHKYRVDYLIVNYYTGERLAIELSPDSTHLNGENIKQDWIKENDKRNSYFFDYKVPTITYTNKYLENIENCFGKIKGIFDQPMEQKTYEELIGLLL